MENKGEIYQRSLIDPEWEVGWSLETKGGSGLQTTVHVAVRGAFRGQKRFGGNHYRGAFGVGSYINKVEFLKDYFIGTR